MQIRLFRGLCVFAVLLSMGSVSAFANNHCEKRIRKAEMNLQQAVRRHGARSRQAENRRRQLEQARASCHY
jgi:hypothetical protein